MDVEDEVVAGVETPGHAVGLDEGGGIGLPEEEVAVGVEAVAGVHEELHAGNAVLPVVGAEARRLAVRSMRTLA